MRIRLNNLNFSTGAAPLGIAGLEQLAPAIRDTSATRRSDLQSATRYIYNTWYKWGLGWNRADRDTGRGVGGLRDATMDTRHRVAERPLAHEVQSHAAPADHFAVAIHYNGDLWGFFEDDYDASSAAQNVARKYGATSDDWTGGGNINGSHSGTVAEGARLFDAVVHKGRMYSIGSAGRAADSGLELRYRYFYSTDGATWTFAGTPTGWPNTDILTTTITRRNNFEDRGYGQLLDFGNTLMVALFDVVNSEIEVYYTTDEGTNWTAGAVIQSSSGPKAFLRWSNPFNSPPTDSPVLVTSDGIYRVDSAGTTSDLILALDGHADTGRGAAIGLGGQLMFGSGATGAGYELFSNMNIFQFGPPGDGFVAARQGHINKIIAPLGRYFYVSYGGHVAGDQASIFAIRYEWQQDPVTGWFYRPWHSMYQEADANIDITTLVESPEDDGTPRLHFALEHASSSEMYHLENHDDSEAATGTTHKRATTGFMEMAEEDFSDPHETKTILRTRIDADNLSADDTGQYAEHEYGIDGAAWTNVSNFGNYVSGDKALFWGRTQQNVTGQTEAGNSEGIAAVTLRNRLVFKGAEASQGPSLKELEVTAVTLYDDLLRFVVPIDLDATTSLGGDDQRSAEQVHDELITILRTNTLVPFEYGKQTAIYVRVRMPQVGELAAQEVSQQFDSQDLVGKMVLVLEEVQR